MAGRHSETMILFCCYTSKPKPALFLRQFCIQLVQSGCSRCWFHKNQNMFVCWRLYDMTAHALFDSTDANFKEQTRLSLCISLLSVSWRIYFWFVSLSAPWRRGHMEVSPPPLPWGQSPQPCWPLCLFAAALIHRRSLPRCATSL